MYNKMHDINNIKNGRHGSNTIIQYIKWYNIT